MSDLGPLSGTRVIELGVAMAGPFCGMTLADYGAEVIKIERPGEGDVSRRWMPQFKGNVGYYFAAANRNKKSLALDLKSEAGIALLKELVATADVVIDNFRIGVLDELGIGFEALSAINPRMVYCCISGFGPTGPRAQERANDIFMQAFSGGMSITGEEGRGPVKAGISVADVGAGMFGVIGVLMGLQARERTGKGQRVDTSLLEGQLAMLAQNLTLFFATGKPPVRRGTASQMGVPYQAFRAKDDDVVVASFTDRMWEGVCAAIEHPEWATDERYSTTKQRAVNRAELIALLTDVFPRRTVADWIERLSANGVPCTAINTIDKVVADPQVTERDMIVEVEHPTAGTLRMAGLPIKFSDTPGRIASHPPLLGEHSVGVLRDLGLSEERIAELLRQQVIAVPN